MKKTSIVKIVLMLLIIALFSTTVYAVDGDDETTEGTKEETTQNPINEEAREGEQGDGSQNDESGEEQGDGSKDDESGEEQGDTDEWADFSGVNVEINKEANGVVTTAILKISNIPIDKLSEQTMYYILIHNQKNIQISANTLEDDAVGSINVRTDKETVKNFSDSKIRDCLENNGDIYVTIVEKKYTGEYKKVLEDKKVERPSLLPLGSRMQCYFFNDYTAAFFKEVSNSETRKINIKIGEITDKNILLSIKNGEANCLQKLMNYAKTAESIYSITVPVGRSSSVTSNMNLVNDKYYYVYMEMDDEDGKYYPVEDVSLYQALVNEWVGKNLCDYLSNDFKWNLGNDETGNAPTTTDNESQETEKKDETTSPKAIPAAGIKSMLMVIVALTGIAVFCSYKYNKWKGIK